MCAATSAPENDARARLEARYRNLSRVLDDVRAERSLAVYLAHRRGVSVAEIAEATWNDEDGVRKIIERYERDEDADSYEEGPDWVELWPHHGWHISA